MKIYQVDSFTNEIFKGNPAGVCILQEPADEEWMQKVAMEMNLSETAFLLKTQEGFNLRWFTPQSEVDLCGHATLASAHILWETGILKPEDGAVFHTRSGKLTAIEDRDYIVLNFPIEEDKEEDLPDGLLKSLGVPLIYSGRNRMDYIVEIDNESTLRNLKPDFGLMKEFNPRGIIVTCRSDNPEYDFVSRFFAPGVGVNEDPVTGSAHCCLGPYWKRRLGKNEFSAYQASKRGGKLKVTVTGDRVLIAGKAVTVFSADLKE